MSKGLCINLSMDEQHVDVKSIKVKTHEDFMLKHEHRWIEYEALTQYIKSSKYMMFRHLSEKCNYHEFPMTPNNFSKGQGCPVCFGKQVKTKEMCQKELDDLYGENIFSILSENFKYSQKNLIRHNICGYERMVQTFNMLKKNKDGTPYWAINCPKCSSKLPKTTEEFTKFVFEYSEGACSLLTDYINYGTHCKMRCNKKDCGYIFDRTPSDFIQYRQFCPLCSEKSQGESNIIKYLKKYNIQFKKEYIFENCKYENVLRFDFAIFDNSGQLLGIIEFDGKQHFIDKAWKGHSLEEQRLKDNIKTKHCRKNNIPFLRIHYKQLNIINELLDDFLENMNTYVGMNNFYGMTEKEYYA